jgi:PAS domain S-box-containing protein
VVTSSSGPKTGSRSKLALPADEVKVVRAKLAATTEALRVKTKQLAVTAKLNERSKAEKAATAEKLRLKASQLARIAKEKEVVMRKLAMTVENLQDEAREFELIKVKDDAILSSIGDGVVVTGKDGKIQLVNKAFERMFGWRKREVRGKSFVSIVPMLDEKNHIIPSSHRLLTKMLENHARMPTELVNYVRKDKKNIAVSVTAEPIDIGGEFIGTVSVLRDVTKEREIDKAKTEFVALASHQLRTPLSAVSWYSEMLLAGDAGELNDKQKKYLEEVYRGNRRMTALVNALLNVSRLELGTFIIEPVPTNLQELAQKAIDELKFLIDERKIRLEARYDKNLPSLVADPKLMTIVLQNLLTNAVKYTPLEGTVRLDILLLKAGASLGGHKMTKDHIAISVADNGYGIPKDQQGKIFTKLFRAENVRVMDTEGTGLGLYIAKTVIDKVGGNLWFDSEENKGSTFYVTLPVAGMKKKAGTKALE